MKFTYDSYRNLIRELREHNYKITDYYCYKNVKKACILRHDVDQSLWKALQLAKIEAKLNVNSTYFILLTSDFYNVFSSQNKEIIHEISELGHTIGLHFDEVTYFDTKMKLDMITDLKEYEVRLCSLIQAEATTLSDLLNMQVDIVSMHRPSKFCLECDLKIPEIINSYGQEFFKGFKYLSDSRRRWREDVLSYIREEKFERLHILTHAFWYHETDINLKDTLSIYLHQAQSDRYEILDRNFTHLDDALAGKD